MTSAHVFVAASLDGFIARRNGDLTWLTPEGADHEDHGFNTFCDSIDGIIMGRKTWEKVSSFDEWPFAKPVIVLSSQLRTGDLPKAKGSSVRAWNCSPLEVMNRVASEGWVRAYVDGGQLIQSFLRNRLVAEITLTHIPILLGEGISLFGGMDAKVLLKHMETRAFPSGLVQSRYQIV